MKYLVLALFLTIPTNVSSKEFLPCPVELASYSLEENRYIKTCQIDEKEFKFRAASYNRRGHTCNISGTAEVNGNKYIFNKGECAIDFTPNSSGMNVEFSQGCYWGYCGAGIGWKNGEYIKVNF